MAIFFNIGALFSLHFKTWAYEHCQHGAQLGKFAGSIPPGAGDFQGFRYPRKDRPEDRELQISS